MINLYIVRHGTTSAMEQLHLQGSSDSALSPRGREEARLTGVALKSAGIEYAFSSPMGRARETADIICSRLGLTYQVIDELREMDFGFFEERKYFDAPGDDTPLWIRLGVLARIMIAQITGESLFKVGHRAKKAWIKISDRVQQGNVLVISHGALINYLLKYLLPREIFQEIQPVQTEPCSITELQVFKPGDSKLIRLSDTRHLEIQPKND